MGETHRVAIEHAGEKTAVGKFFGLFSKPADGLGNNLTVKTPEIQRFFVVLGVTENALVGGDQFFVGGNSVCSTEEILIALG